MGDYFVGNCENCRGMIDNYATNTVRHFQKNDNGGKTVGHLQKTIDP